MGTIPENEVEWEVVARLQTLLSENPHPYFGITHTFAIFTSLLCWCLQSLRNKDRPPSTKAWKSLSSRSVVDDPWNLRVATTSPASPTFGVITMRRHNLRPPDDLSVAEFLIGLRNAVAHGTEKNIAPFPSVEISDGRALQGFKFHCEGSFRRTFDGRVFNAKWEGDVILTGAQMRKLGVLTAEHFLAERPRVPARPEQDAA